MSLIPLLGAGAIAGGFFGAKAIHDKVFPWIKQNAWSYLSGQDDLEAAKNAQLELQQQAQGFNSAEAAKDREFQMMMSNTAIQRQMADLKAAGLNPWLALQSGMPSGSSTPAGAAATSSVGSAGSRTPKWSQLVSAANQLINTGAKAGSTAANSANAALKVAALAIMAFGGA